LAIARVGYDQSVEVGREQLPELRLLAPKIVLREPETGGASIRLPASGPHFIDQTINGPIRGQRRIEWINGGRDRSSRREDLHECAEGRRRIELITLGNEARGGGLDDLPEGRVCSGRWHVDSLRWELV